MFPRFRPLGGEFTPEYEVVWVKHCQSVTKRTPYQAVTGIIADLSPPDSQYSPSQGNGPY
jgi:hypothetical protein